MQDDNWNVVAIYNATTGAIDERFAYSAYGIVVPLNPNFTAYSGGNYDWTVLYTGRELDNARGLYYFRGRFYHTLAGAFVIRDPIEVDINPYCYCASSPNNFTDPSGNDPPDQNKSLYDQAEPGSIMYDLKLREQIISGYADPLRNRTVRCAKAYVRAANARSVAVAAGSGCTQGRACYSSVSFLASE